jgi:hypothetical protein
LAVEVEDPARAVDGGAPGGQAAQVGAKPDIVRSMVPGHHFRELEDEIVLIPVRAAAAQTLNPYGQNIQMR